MTSALVMIFGAALLVGLIGLGQSVSGIEADEGVDFWVNALDLVQAILHHFPRGNFAPRELSRQFGNC